MDRIDITGRQNLTLGSGARAYGMGGAFLARADDATAASWNPAGLSYLRVPEVSLVGVSNSFDVTRGLSSDSFEGRAIDFAAFTWPIGLGDVRGAVQLSYQRAISFDGSRRIEQYNQTTGLLEQFEDGSSDGGFDVIAFGTGPSPEPPRPRRLHGEPLAERLRTDPVAHDPEGRPAPAPRVRPRLPPERVELQPRPDRLAVRAAQRGRGLQDPVHRRREPRQVAPRLVGHDRRHRGGHDQRRLRRSGPARLPLVVRVRPLLAAAGHADPLGGLHAHALVRGPDPELLRRRRTGQSHDGVPAVPPPPIVYPERQYPTLRPVPDPSDPTDPARLQGQQDAEQIRVGVEWVLIRGGLKVPLRAGYFNDRQIIPIPGGDPPRFNGFTVGTGLILGSMLLDVAYVYEFGEYSVAVETTPAGGFDVPPTPPALVRNSLTTNRFYASVIYRFSGRWQP